MKFAGKKAMNISYTVLSFLGLYMYISQISSVDDDDSHGDEW